MRTPQDHTNFVDHCRELARTRPDETAYVWLRDGESEEASWTFAELDRQARKVAVQLEERGLRGSRALLLYTPGLEFIASFLGCLYADVVAVPLNAPRNEKAAATMLGIARHADPGILLTDEVLFDATSAHRAALAGIEVLATDRLPLEAARGWRPAAVDPEHLAFLQYTSGSTGTPKGVEVTHANLIANERMIRAGFGHDDDTVFVSWLPMFHDMGLVGNVLQPLFLGVKSVLMAPTAFVQQPARWLRALTEYGGTTTGGPNFGYELCVQRVRDEALEGLDLSAWKVAYSGSEPVRARTLERFTEKFAAVGFRPEAFYPCYGLAEASLYVTGGVPSERPVVLRVNGKALEEHRVEPARSGDPHARRLVGCGRAWLDQRVLVVDPETSRVLPDGAVGEIWIAGGNVARGYRNLPPEADDPFVSRLDTGEGPFLRTGDLGFMRDDELFVTGRLKDVLIQNGRNYYPQDIELAAGSNHPYLRVDFTAAFTVEEDDNERLVVVQEVHRRHSRPLERDGAEGDALRTELVGAVRQAVSTQYGLRAWSVVLVKHASIPKTSSGKIQRRKCRDLWRRGELSELRPVAERASP